MGGGVNWKKIYKKYKTSITRLITTRDVMCNMRTMVNTAIWYIPTLLTE